MDELKVVATLSLHHRDPFDRLLIAQAMVQGIQIASDDANFAQYEVSLFWDNLPADESPNSSDDV